MKLYACQCGHVELAQDREPVACSRCPKCGSGIGRPVASKHRIENGRCVTCRRPVWKLVAVGVQPDRMETA